MSNKYRKKPVVIEAVLWSGKNTDEVKEFTQGKARYREWFQHNESGVDKDKLEIATLEGVITASIGDYIIKGVQGEFYPCKPDIFEATYEVVNESA